MQTPMAIAQHRVAGAILAGGQSRRYGRDKAFVPVAGASLIEHVIARAAPQVASLMISATGDPRFTALGLPIVADTVREKDGSPAGPLAGVLAALDWLADRDPAVRWLASFAVDTPLLPLDMVARLRQAADEQDAAVACCRSAGRLHPLLALWSADLGHALRAALESGERAAHRFVQQQRLVIVDFEAEPFDPFANLNTPADLERLTRHKRAPEI
jgi:molybdopterin-guanine dinucleotide biosynthesis protein A